MNLMTIKINSNGLESSFENIQRCFNVFTHVKAKHYAQKFGSLTLHPETCCTILLNHSQHDPNVVKFGQHYQVMAAESRIWLHIYWILSKFDGSRSRALISKQHSKQVILSFPETSTLLYLWQAFYLQEPTESIRSKL